MDPKSTEEEGIMIISKSLLRKAEAALKAAQNKGVIIPIPRTTMSLCPREMVPPQFKVYTYIEQNGESFAIGTQ